MPCDRPTGNCTSPCSECAGATPPAPIVPRCQDIVLTPGTYPRATVVVNASGCISAVSQGEPEAYTPEECCPGGGGTGGGLTGARGPQGDPGAAATIAVNASIPVGMTPAWTVQNLGTPSAAVFQFTAPAPPVVPPGTAGVTGSVAGLAASEGKVTALPASLVTGVDTQTSGSYAAYIEFEAAPESPSAPDSVVLSLNLDALALKIADDIGGATLAQQIQDIQVALTDAPLSIFQVAAVTGINLSLSGTTVVPTVRVAAVPNIWLVGAAYVGAQVTVSDGTIVAVTSLGQVTLPALAFPVAIAPASP